MYDFGNILIKFRNEFWLILFREYIIPKLFAVDTITAKVRLKIKTGLLISRFFCTGSLADLLPTNS
jgi:hypothetical protein